ncbi:CPBP family intramembrane glutamic endopeptidase [Chitinophaga vietnamensis]|uniref:CPBP family intramembrane glutamic endopeptidase n=1 Tax=Chitinophaga vietnamensis TaxID=2593957 RepID=UPI00117877E6|nr:CPBP family intramembrane glutamic endopeptidase [Chitinophaga vietnamensis]
MPFENIPGTIYTALASLLPIVIWMLFRKPVSKQTLLWLALVFIANEVLVQGGSSLQSWWFPALRFNWLGKLLSIFFTLSVIPLLVNEERPYQSVGLRWYVNPATLRLCLWLGAAFIVLKAVGNLFAIEKELITPENYLYQATMPGLQEELCFRGLYLWLLLRASGALQPSTEVWMLALLFGLGHGFQISSAMHYRLDIGVLVLSTLSGFLYGYIRVKSGSLLLPVLLHNAANIAITIVLALK